MMKEMIHGDIDGQNNERALSHRVSHSYGATIFESIGSFKQKELKERNLTLKSTRLKLGLLIHSQTKSKLVNPMISDDQSSVTSEVYVKSPKEETLLSFGMTRAQFSYMKEDATKKNPISVIRAKVLKKKEEEVTKNEFQIIERKAQNIKRVLNSINKGLERSNSLSDFKNLLNKKKDLLKEQTIEVPSSLFHMNLLHLRNLPDYRIHIPRKCYHFREKDCVFNLKDLSFPKLFNILKSKLPFANIKEVETVFEQEMLTKDIKIFTIDEVTCIPYTILKSPEYSQEKGEITFVFNDLFDNFLVHFHQYKKIVQKNPNKKIILFNYPGQLFTVFKSENIISNIRIAEIFDSFIFYLQEIEKIDLSKESLKLLGIGYGGNIVAIFASLFLASFPKLSALLFVNAFMYVDNTIYSSLLDCRKSFQEVPSDLSELAHELWASLTLTTMPQIGQIKEMQKKNPLSIESRIFLIDCCLEGTNLLDLLQCIDIPIYAVHSLQNSFVNVQHADILTEYRQDKRIENIGDIFLPKFLLKKEKLPPVRDRAYLDGGHDIQTVKTFIQENPENFFEIITQFLQR